ncbi:type II secretion system protein J [Candidatus Ruminimicrobium bovinum]|uniref:PulJ/GspJ family protein n=1 Tax=Candidatus Ruminimicrobium bovinum TaxID=3242779 RepID=UPI0039B9C071
MDLMKIFKNKKAFSLVEIVIAMLIASIVMLSVYFMLVIVYNQFNDLSATSETFNNLQVFERMFQRSAATCQYYDIYNNIEFRFFNTTDGKRYETYYFKEGNNGVNLLKDNNNISNKNKSEKIKYYSNDVNSLPDIDIDKNYKLCYCSGTSSRTITQGYLKVSTFTTDNYDRSKEIVLFDNIVKVYYEISKGITKDKFYNYTGIDLNEKWIDGFSEFKPIYTPFIKLIIIYKDKNDRLRRSYITCRLRGIEGVEFNM